MVFDDSPKDTGRERESEIEEKESRDRERNRVGANWLCLPWGLGGLKMGLTFGLLGLLCG